MKKTNTIKKIKHRMTMPTGEKYTISISKMTMKMDRKIKNFKEESNQNKKETKKKIRKDFHG